MSRKVRRKKVYFLTSEITPKKVYGNDVDFLTIEIASKKVRENDLEICRNLASTYRRNINVESMWIRCGAPVGEASAQVFSCGFPVNIFKNTCFEEHLSTAV